MASTIPSEFDARLQSLLQNGVRQLQADGERNLPSVSGQVLKAMPVVERQEASGDMSRGVVIEGRFVALALPDDISQGDRVDLKLVTAGGELKLLFLQRSDPQVASAPELRQKLLESLLKSLDLNHESLDVLRTALSALPELPTVRDTAARLPEALARFLKHQGIGDLLLPVKPDQLVRQMELHSPDTASRIIARVIGEREANLGGHTGKIQDVVRQLVRELEFLNVELPNTVGEQVTPASTGPAQSAPSSVFSREQLKQIAPAFEKILTILRSVTSGDGAETPGELEPFRKVVAQQIDQLKNIESRVTLLLRDVGSSGSLAELVSVLDTLRRSTEGQIDPVAKLLNAFARDLLKGIQSALVQPEQTDALREVLGEGLRRLYTEFGLVPFETRIGLPAEAEGLPDVPGELRGMLRLLESKLVTILADPEIDQQIEQMVQGNNQKLSAQLKNLMSTFEGTLKILTDINRPEFKALEEKLGATIQLLQSIESSKVDGSTDTTVPAQSIKVLLKDLMTQLEGFGSRTDLQAAIPEGGVAASPPADQLQKTIRQIERQLLNLLTVGQREEQDFPDSLTRLVELISRNQVIGGQPGQNLPIGDNNRGIQKVKLLLQQLAIELPVSGSHAEEQLAEAVYDLGALLPESVSRVVPRTTSEMKHQLQQNMVKLHRYLEEAAPRQPEGAELKSVDTDSLKRVSSMLAAQETLQRMAPVMKALGEPILLLFPFMIGNFLSRAQFTVYPDSVGREKEQLPSGAKTAETFTRLRVVIPLPRLGKVMADVAYRKGEILINLGFENQKVADFIEPRLVLLRQALRGAGFSVIEIITALVSADALKGEQIEAESLRKVLHMGTLEDL